MVGHSLHVLSDHLRGITGVHYKVNNSLLIILHLQVLHIQCTHYILHNIIPLHLCLYVAVCSYLTWILCFEILF